MLFPKYWMKLVARPKPREISKVLFSSTNVCFAACVDKKCIHACMHACMQVCMDVCRHICRCLCVCLCLYGYVYVYVHVWSRPELSLLFLPLRFHSLRCSISQPCVSLPVHAGDRVRRAAPSTACVSATKQRRAGA